MADTNDNLDDGALSRATSLFEATNQLVLEVFRLNGTLIAAGDALSKDNGLTSARWQVLGAIMLSPKPLPVAGIARNMGLTRQGVQRTVEDLKRLDMIRVEENPHHRRAVLVLPTAKGEAAYSTQMERQERWMTIVDPGLTLDQLAQASAVLRQFRARLEQAGTPTTVNGPTI